VTDLDDVLSDPDVDIMSVCTPTPSHPGIAIRALRAGKNVLLEKPIALTVDAARMIADTASVSAGVLMVAHVVRFMAGYQRVRADAESGRLGTVRHVRATRLSATPTWAPWLVDASRSGGMLVDFAIHDFDQLNPLPGAPRLRHDRGDRVAGPVRDHRRIRGRRARPVTTGDLPWNSPFTCDDIRRNPSPRCQIDAEPTSPSSRSSQGHARDTARRRNTPPAAIATAAIANPSGPTSAPR
jgi:predicted dehydrogenase